MTILQGEPQVYGGPARTPEPGGRGFLGRAGEAASFALRESPFGLRRLDAETYDEMIDGIERETGERLVNPVSARDSAVAAEVTARTKVYRDRGLRGSSAYVRAYREVQEAAFASRVDELRQRYPAAASLAPEQSFEKRRERRAQSLERRAGEHGLAANLVGGVAAAAQDPVTFATGPAGLGAKTVLGAAVKTAALNAGLETAVQPAVQARREAIGLEASFGQGALNVAAAGLFGGALGGGGKLLQKIFTRPEIAAAGRASENPEMRAGAAEIDRELEIEADVEAAAGGPLGPLEAGSAHQRLDAAERVIDALDAGEAPAPADVRRVRGDGETIKASSIRDDVAVTTRGREVPVTYAIVDLDDLIASHDQSLARNPRFPAELQPRDRARAASAAQIADIAANLNPRLLDQSNAAGDGAPVIRADGVVLSGNGRVLAIASAYERGFDTAGAYRDYLTAQGYPTGDTARPVLVRVARDLEDAEGFAREANERATAALSAPEQARTDAANLKPGDFALLDGADPSAVKNARFIRTIVDRIAPEAERGALMDRHGALSAEGARRVRNAIAAYAYDDAALIDRLIEGEDELKSLGAALIDAAPDFARLKGEIDAGAVDPRVDVRAHVAEAAAIVAEARRSGRNVAEFVGQQDMFSGVVDARTVAFLRLFFRNDDFTAARARAKIAEELSFYVREARKVSSAPALFGEPGDPASRLLAALGRRADSDDAGAPGLFDPRGNDRAPSLLPDADGGSRAPAAAGAGEGGGVTAPEPSAAADLAKAFDDPHAAPAKVARDAEIEEAIAELGDDPEAALVTGGVDAKGNQIDVQSRAELDAELDADQAIIDRLKGCVT